MKFLTILALSSVLGGCGLVTPVDVDSLNGSNTNNPSRPNLERVEVTQSSVNGNWKSDCYSDSSDGGVYIIENWILSNSSVMRTQYVYSDRNCTAQLLTMTLSGSFLVNNNSTLTETLNYISVIPNQNSVVDLFNRTNFCGSTNWVLQSSQVFNNVNLCGIDSPKTRLIENYDRRQLFVIDGAKVVRFLRQ